MKLRAVDGMAEYLENLRAIDLFLARADSGTGFPGSHAGVADLFSWTPDKHDWDPMIFWQRNLRMQVAANVEDKRVLATPAGICVPETMGFAHETQRDLHDPVTDVVAMRTVFSKDLKRRT